MKWTLILLIGAVPCTRTLAQAPNYFGTGRLATPTAPVIDPASRFRTNDDFRTFLVGTTWQWVPQRDIAPAALSFFADGFARNSGGWSAKFVVKNPGEVELENGSDTAVLKFDPAATQYTGIDFDKKSKMTGKLQAVADAEAAASARLAGPEPSTLAAARARYEQELKASAAPIKDHYAQALDALAKSLAAQKDEAGVRAVQQEFARLGLLPNRPAGPIGEAKVIVWNQHNGQANDRGTRVINVVLLNAGREIWRQDGIAIPWLPGQDTNVEVSVPHLPTQKLRVEVAETVNNHGGLAEVEYWWEGHNLARGRPVQVSGVWFNNAKVVGTNLTDGITSSKAGETGYWTLPDQQTGWAEIELGVHD